MKQKTKKILAGLGIGLALGSSAMLTGCSSDITFNQKDLDNVISNVNTYLEDTQNNNSEYVRNTLNEFLIDIMNSSIGVNNISYRTVEESYICGIKQETVTNTYMRNIEGSLIKDYYSTTKAGRPSERYIEIMAKSDTAGSYGIPQYDIERYEISNNQKNYTKTENATDLSYLSGGYFKSYVDVYSSILGNLNSENELAFSDYVKSVENDVVTYKCVAVNQKPTTKGEGNMATLVLSFKNNKLIKFENISTCYLDDAQYIDYCMKTTITFDYENETISFDKTGFNTNTSSNS